jgi:selenobiotic family peptide radical SAM maturase
MVWPSCDTGLPAARAASNRDLLVLKMMLENLTPDQVADEAGIGVSDIHSLLLEALNTGIILGPEPGIIRERSFPATPDSRGRGQENEWAEALLRYKKSRVFALQWHITQACDLHCRHCYDRTPATPLSLNQEIKVLDTLTDFCDTHHLFGQVTFTGGNPLMHPHFLRLYQEAADRGFFLGILGNPATPETIEKICAIQPPSFFQVSLEGLEPHNDYIRGPGHFKRIMTFLTLLKKNRIYSKVMLTLTRTNRDQVLELGEILRDRTNQFTFNRLSLQGEGANLTMADVQDYDSFLESYTAAAKNNPTLGLKDNLFNILHLKAKTPLFGGCTGYGCGAAFNFVSLLPTGEVHACRKFPSPLGNITQQTLTTIYHSKTAQRYRRGPEECASCTLNPVCRGCMASSHSQGLDVFRQKDPYCFFQTPQNAHP